MSTNSSISVWVGDKIHSVYCHWDGYLDWNGKKLFNHYNTQEKAEALVALGDISSLHESIDCPEGHSFGSDVSGHTVFYGRDRGEENVETRISDTIEEAVDKVGQEYDYMFKDGQWHWRAHGKEGILTEDSFEGE